MSPISETKQQKSSSSQKLPVENPSDAISKGDETGSGKAGAESQQFIEESHIVEGVAVEAKCATENESSDDSRDNKDLLGMMNEELEHETELLYE